MLVIARLVRCSPSQQDDAVVVLPQSRTPPSSPRQVGWRLRERLKLTTVKSNGVFVVPSTERAKVEALAARYGIPLDNRSA